MEKGTRLKYLDTVKGIAIILVVIGHSTVASDGVLTWLTSFHMPLFFIVSGLLFYLKKSASESFKTFFRKRFRGIMVPYLVFSLINMIIIYIKALRHPWIAPVASLKDACLQTLSLYGISVLWFLPALFFGELLFYALTKKLPKLAAALIIIVLAFVPVFAKGPVDSLIPETVTGLFPVFLRFLLYAFLRIPSATAFLGIGYVTGKILSCGFLKGVSGSATGILAGIVFMILNAVIAFANGRVDMHYIVWGNPLLFYLGATLGTLGLILICKHLSELLKLKFKQSPKFGLISFLGANSLIVMLTHLDLQVINFGLKIARAIDRAVTHSETLLFFFFLTLFILATELIIIFVMNRWFYFLLGKKKPEKRKG